MRLARVANNLADSETFECRLCCLLVTAEQALEFSERTMFKTDNVLRMKAPSRGAVWGY